MILFLSCLIVSLAVIIHYEALRLLTIWIPRLSFKHRFGVLLGVLGALCAHIVEILLFACGYSWLSSNGEFGYLTGNFDGSFLDCVYFSFTTYSSLGLGDIEPMGGLRFLVGLEALAGLVLITWTASFMFLEMRRFWQEVGNG